MDKSYLELFLEYKDSMAALTTDNQFYENMADIVERGKSSYSLFNRYFEKKIDLTWVEEIEACIIPLDNIIRVPRKFIVQEEEIVPIERAKKITAESVRHLAQHTNMIAKVEGDDVTPNEILNVFREESFEVYENRFVYTLMQNLIRFIDVRYDVLFNLSDDENMASLKMENETKRGNEKIIYKLEISTQSGGNDLEDNATIDGENASAFQRIERIKKIINEYAHSGFMKELQGCVLVRPPIMRTNAIQKNPNFRACLKLWQFIQSYRDVGYEIIAKESNEMVNDEYKTELNRLIATNYMLLKNNTISEDSLGKKAKMRRIKPKVLKRLAEELVLDYDLNEVEIKRVFVDEVRRAAKRKFAGEQRIKEAIDRALASENARKKAIEDKIKAKIAHEKEMERRRIERERARIAREKALEKERKAKEKAKLKAKKEKELALAKEKARKEKERARLAKEREEKLALIAKQKEEARVAKEKARKEKELAEKLERERIAKEKARLAKEKAAQAEKERVEKAKAKEKERLAKEKAARLAKEKAEKDKAKEKARLAKEKAALAEKERADKAKEKEKERLAKEKAIQLEKDRIAKEKAKEKEKEAREKAALIEKERVAKAKAKEKERLAAEKAVQLEKEKAAKEKAKEKEKLAREKANLLEKERIAKAKAKEKERIAAEKAKQIEKERIAKAKAKEKEKLAREKAKQMEKERIEKAKQREKDKIAKEKAAKAAKEKAKKEQ